MPEERRRWVILGVADSTRAAIIEYADLRRMTIAEVFEQEFSGLDKRMAVIRLARERWIAKDRATRPGAPS